MANFVKDRRLVGFNGISTSIGYLMPKPVYTYYMYGLLTYNLMIPS